jgi:hypothetical protein
MSAPELHLLSEQEVEKSPRVAGMLQALKGLGVLTASPKWNFLECPEGCLRALPENVDPYTIYLNWNEKAYFEADFPILLGQSESHHIPSVMTFCRMSRVDDHTRVVKVSTRSLQMSGSKPPVHDGVESWRFVQMVGFGKLNTLNLYLGDNPNFDSLYANITGRGNIRTSLERQPKKKEERGKRHESKDLIVDGSYRIDQALEYVCEDLEIEHAQTPRRDTFNFLSLINSCMGAKDEIPDDLLARAKVAVAS